MQKTQRRTMVRWLLVSAAILLWPLLAFSGLGGLLVRTISPRPMFCKWVGFQDRVIPWQAYMPIVDRKGNFGYMDPELNMFVVVVTGDPAHRSFVTPASTSARARLLPTTQYEVTVEAQSNVLIIAFPNNGTEAFPIEPGMAHLWYDELVEIYKTDPLNLLEELQERYRGPERQRFADAIRRARSVH